MIVLKTRFVKMSISLYNNQETEIGHIVSNKISLLF